MYTTFLQTSLRERLYDWVVLAAHGLFMWLAIYLSFELGFASNEVVAIWPAAGIGVWVAMRYGWKSLPTIFLSHTGYSLWSQSGDIYDLVIPAAGNAFACYIAALLYRRNGSSLQPFRSVRDTLRFFLLMGVVTSVISAAIGVALLHYKFALGPAMVRQLGWRWFFSDLTGVVLIAPAFIAFAHTRQRLQHQSFVSFWTKTVLGVLLCAAVITIQYAAMITLPDRMVQYPIIMITMPLCMWLALDVKSDSSIPLISATIVFSLAMTLAAVVDADDASFFAVQLYGVVVMCTSLVLHATSAERLRAVRELAEERKLLEHKIAERTDELRTIAETDSLTGLANRRSFEASLGQVVGRGSDDDDQTYLLLMDLDHFKIVNDTSGHSAGDELLRSVSRLIKGCVRGADLIGRLGGDEFALLLQQCPEDRARRIAERIRSGVEQLRFRWDDETYQIGASIGVVQINASVLTVEDAKQLADAACYAAKHEGRNRVHMTSSDVTSLEAHRGEVRWAQRLKEALDTDRFVLHGQVIENANPSVADAEHVEVLLRLRDMQSRKLVPPGAFMPAAERYGLAVKADAWIVRNLIRMLYLHSAFDASARKYWVNLSPASVSDEQFVDELVEMISDSPIEPGLLNFEISETAVIRNMDKAGQLMSRLHDLGCKFALDNFGAGLSSFADLKRLPLDHLKIHGDFILGVVESNTDKIFVKSIIDIAHEMDMRVVATFVESQDIRDAVAHMGVDYVQGEGIHAPELLMPKFESLTQRNRKLSIESCA